MLIKKQMKLASLAAVGFGCVTMVAACGSDDSSDDDDSSTTTTVAYADVSGFVATDCARSGCHDAATKAGGADLSTETLLKGAATGVLDRISRVGGAAGVMPVGRTETTSYDSTTNGAKLKTFLSQ